MQYKNVELLTDPFCCEETALTNEVPLSHIDQIDWSVTAQ